MTHTCSHYLALAWLQVGILVGKGGTALKKLGQEARIAIEAFLERKVRRTGYLQQGWGLRARGMGLQGQDWGADAARDMTRSQRQWLWRGRHLKEIDRRCP